MKTPKLILVLLLVTTSMKLMAQQQASLTIMNKSDRYLTTKIIMGSEKKGSLYKTVAIAPKGKEIAYFVEPGRYFTKSMAIMMAKDTAMRNDTLFSKGNLFDVIADNKRGYSNITIKFTVKESKKPVLDGVVPITRKEYETD